MQSFILSHLIVIPQEVNVDTFFEYLKWRGDLPFSKVAFNDVDAAIFARLSYMPFDGIVSSEYEFMNLREACNKAIVRSDFNYHAVNPKKDKEFLELIKKSKRFSELEITNFIYEVDETLEKQFGACIFKIADGKYYLAYRGTDKVLIGWKEDLNMGVEFPVPAQTSFFTLSGMMKYNADRFKYIYDKLEQQALQGW